MSRTNTNVNTGITAFTDKSVQGDGSLANPIQLVNDQATPGVGMYYGTNGAGTKGYFNISAIILPPLANKQIWIGDATNAAIPHSVSGVVLLGNTGITTFGSFSSAALQAALTDETGSGLAVFNSTPRFADFISIGANVGTPFTGFVSLIGKTSGAVNVSVQDIAGTWTMKLPTSAPATNGQSLIAQTTGDTAWAYPSIGNLVTLSNDKIWVGNSGNIAVERGVSGIVNMDNTGIFAFNPSSFTSANLFAAMTTKTGTGLNVFSTAPTFETDISIGVTGGTQSGVAILFGKISGRVGISVEDTTGTWVLKLPTAVGMPGQYLKLTSGTGSTTWDTPGGSSLTGDLTGQTAAAAPLTVTVPNDGQFHTYSVGAYVTVTASAGVIVVSTTLAWTDETGTGRSYDYFGEGLTTASISVGAVPFPPMTIRVSPNTSITVTTKLSGAGSMTYDVGAYATKIS